MSLSPTARSEFLHLIELHRDGQLTEAQLTELEELVLGDPEAMDVYVRSSELAAGLRKRSSVTSRQAPAATSAAAPAAPRAAVRSLFAVVAAALALIVFAVLPYLNRPLHAEIIGTLAQTQGDIEVVSVDGEMRPIADGMPIAAGETVRTLGVASRAVIVRPDGTRLALVGDTALVHSPLGKNRVTVREGGFSATIPQQRPNRPLRVATPEATIQVLGTEFLLESRSQRTDVRVTRGKVRIVSNDDGRSIEVSEGHQAIAPRHGELFVCAIPSESVHWFEDFEFGLPPGWQLGAFIDEGLPGEAVGGVSSRTHDPAQPSTHFTHGITTHRAWTQGLFTVTTTSCLRITYKLERPGPMYVLLETRDADLAAGTGATTFVLEPTDLVRTEQWWNIPANEWQTAVIPLYRLHEPADQSVRPKSGDVGFQLTFGSLDADRGLVIDEIEVVPIGPHTIDVVAAR